MSSDLSNLEIYRACFEQAPVGLALCRKDNGKYVLINEAFAAIMGRSVEEVMELDYYQITPRKYEQKEQEQLLQLDRQGAYGPYEKEYLHKNGTLVPVRLRGQLLVIDVVEYIWSMVEDLSKEKYRILFQRAAIGLALCDLEGEMVDVNTTFAEMLGYKPEQLEGMTYWNLTPRFYHEQEIVRINEIRDPKKRSYGPYNKHFVHREGHLVPVHLNGLVVEIEEVSYIWSIVEPGFSGDDIPPDVPPDQVDPIQPPDPSMPGDAPRAADQASGVAARTSRALVPCHTSCFGFGGQPAARKSAKGE